MQSNIRLEEIGVGMREGKKFMSSFVGLPSVFSFLGLVRFLTFHDYPILGGIGSIYFCLIMDE